MRIMSLRRNTCEDFCGESGAGSTEARNARIRGREREKAIEQIERGERGRIVQKEARYRGSRVGGDR
jgi:hypothetical protein